MTRTVNLADGWSFRRLGESSRKEPWQQVALPHSPFVSDLDGRNHWFGECEYRRTLEPVPRAAGERVILFVGAAMQTARVFVNDREAGHHAGGFLPFEIDLTAALPDHGPAELLLRLDNRENADIPPGKPYEELDFCWYGGLYRNVELRLRPELHITEAIAANVRAGGGIFLRTLAATPAAATIRVETHVGNTSAMDRRCRVRVEFAQQGVIAASASSGLVTIPALGAQSVGLELTVENPQRWSPDMPHLYDVTISLRDSENRGLDEQRVRYGIRRIAFSRSRGLTINDRRVRLRGTNRHQEMPGVGYAVPRAAQYRDALRIKEAGFDYVRLSHYPQSPEFLAACDELGIVVMNCIPGWQFLGGERFIEACVENARQLIRRDRNHACVILWELSLNETPMDSTLAERLHATGHEEYPGDQMFTCGWMDHYDVFIHSRQHGQIHTWSRGDKALVVAEYGDWEYYAQNDGFDQATGAGVYDPRTNSRQLRRDGERGLRQQAWNHQQALNDTLSSPAVLDGQWAVFDYARGYDPNRAAVGVMDVFRLPKYSYYFYRSQRDAGEPVAGRPAPHEIFIASHWTPASDLRVVVFSNCDEVELRLNGTVVARRLREATALAQHLPHPPHFFDLPHFTPGTLEAIGYVGDKPRARHRVSTPGPAAALELVVDDAGIFPRPGEPDVLIAHARVVDAAGNLGVEETQVITFAVEGAILVHGPTVAAEAGIASVVLRLPPQSHGFTLTATSRAAGKIIPASLDWKRQPAEAAMDAPRPKIAQFVAK